MKKNEFTKKIDTHILEILSKCKVEGDLVFLPDEQMDRKDYIKINDCLKSIGGKWIRSKKAHLFAPQNDPESLIDALLISGSIQDVKKEFQFFPTPSSIAKKLVDMAELKKGLDILEPSAGQGAILNEISIKDVDACELMPENIKILKEQGYNIVANDFLSFSTKKYDRIIANPPFSKQQDIKHVDHMFSLLKEGGILVSVVSESPFFRENKRASDFREFLKQNNAQIVSLESGDFKASGTNVKTRIIKIKKGA